MGRAKYKPAQATRAIRGRAIPKAIVPKSIVDQTKAFTGPRGRLEMGGVLVGHNINGFDVPFLRSLLLRHNIKDKISYHILDTTSLAIEHLMPCGLKSISLKNVKKVLYIETGVAHTALSDTLACLEIYRKLARSYWWERAIWKFRIQQQQQQQH